jgi:putative FmdB family regulatory protein
VENIMPIYEYACPHCRHVFEKCLKPSETTENANCPQCGGRAQHIISSTSFVLKGGGWYVTDYGYRKGADVDGPSAASDAAPSAPAAAEASGQNATPTPLADAPKQAASDTASGTSA